MKARSLLVIGCWIVLLVGRLQGSTIQTDGSSTGVQNALNSAKNGDTVLIPAGSFTWSTTVTARNGVTIQGAGPSKTTINNPSVANNYRGPRSLAIQSTTTDPTRVTQIAWTGCWNIKVSGSPASAPFRIDNCTFDCGTANGILVEFYGNGPGLFDHCTVSAGGGAEPLHNVGYNSGSTTGWYDDLTPGDDSMVVVENCTFSHNPMNDPYFTGTKVIESYYGARTVIRYNQINYCAVDAHGNKPPSYGARWDEIYCNTFYVPPNGNQSSMVVMRGGSGVVWGNKFTGGPNKGAGGIQFYSDEKTNPPLCGPGAGIFQSRNTRTSSPFYVWGNDSALGGVGSNSSNIVAGRDFIVSTSQPSSMKIWQKSTDNAGTTYSYKPYVYPHPLDDGPTDSYGPGGSVPGSTLSPSPVPTPSLAPNPTPVVIKPDGPATTISPRQ